MLYSSTLILYMYVFLWVYIFIYIIVIIVYTYIRFNKNSFMMCRPKKLNKLSL